MAVVLMPFDPAAPLAIRPIIGHTYFAYWQAQQDDDDWHPTVVRVLSVDTLPGGQLRANYLPLNNDIPPGRVNLCPAVEIEGYAPR